MVLSWRSEAFEQIRRRNEQQSAHYEEVFSAYRYEEKHHRHLADKHIEMRNQVGVLQHDLQLFHRDLETRHPGELAGLEDIRALFSTLQEDLSAHSTKDFDDVKIRIDLEKVIKVQKQHISDTAAETELLKSELDDRTGSLADVTNELQDTKSVVETLHKELESTRNLLSATEDRLREVETRNGKMVTKLMDEKQKSADLMNELTTLQHSKGSKAGNIIGGGLSFMKKNFFGASSDNEELGEKEDEDFIEVNKVAEDVDPDDSRSSLFSDVTLPRSVVKTIKCHGCEINDITFGCRKTFITGGADSSMKVFNLNRSLGHLSSAEDPREAIVQDSQHEFSCGGPVISVHSAGEYVAGACGDGIAKLWNVRTGRLRQSLSGHANKVTSIRFVGSGEEKAVTGSADRTIRFWDLSRRQASTIFNLKTNSHIGSVDASSDCNTVCSGHQDGGLRLWNIMTKDRIHFMPKIHKAMVTCVQFDPKHGQLLLSASRDNTISLIDTRTYESLLVLRAPGFNLSTDWSQVSFSPDCSMVAAGSVDGKVFVWDSLNGELHHEAFSGQTAGITSVCWKDSGFLSCDRDGNVVVWG